MLRRSPRAALLWAAAAVVALATAASVAQVLVSLRHQDEAYGRVHAVVVTTRDLMLGHRVTPGDLGARHRRGERDEPGALTVARDAVGRVVAVPLLRGAVVTRRHLADPGRAGGAGPVPPGRRAMRVTVEDGVRPRPGDPVDLYATFDPQTVGTDVEPTLTIARAVPVLAVDRDAGTDRGRATVGVTVLVDADAAKRLAFASATGTIAIAIAPPEDAARR
jgi:Flp pilus assembly protein CpaB